jgi:hypothetical protein
MLGQITTFAMKYVQDEVKREEMAQPYLTPFPDISRPPSRASTLSFFQ